MSYPSFTKPGVWAAVRGVDYPARYDPRGRMVYVSLGEDANPDPTLFTWNEEHRLWLSSFPETECERVVEIRTYAKLHGHRCEVDSIDRDGSADLVYADWNGAWAANNGFVQTDKGTFRKTVHVSELYDYHEEHLDLLFDGWREQNFPRPAEEAS